MSDLLSRIRRAIARRPVRVAEAVIAIAAVLGVTIGPEVLDAVEQIVAVVAAVGIVSGEVAQRWTTALSDPRLRDGHEREGAE